MSRIFIRTDSPEDWKKLLADPKHWRTGYSAKALAYSWHSGDGFPERVATVFVNSGIGLFQNTELLLAMPEYQVSLESEVRPSQNDIFVLARSGDQLVSIMVEGKKSESFGPKICDWLEDDQGGKEKRLAFLLGELGLEDTDQIGSIRYQLLHRTASALIEARKFNAANALMLVHSFSQSDEGHKDFTTFLALFGVDCPVDSVVLGGNIDGIDLYFGWVRGDEKYLRAPDKDE